MDERRPLPERLRRPGNGFGPAALAHELNLDRSVFYRRMLAVHLLAREETGLRCLLQVALHGGLDAPCESPVPIAQIASAEGISDVYAAKLMRQLRLAGLVESTRGAAGGYRLSRAAAAISVWDAIRALDESFLPGTTCDCRPADRIDCRRTTACAVTSLWRRLGQDIRDSLEAVSLADLCGGSLERPDRVELPVARAAATPASIIHASESRSARSHAAERNPTC